MGAALAFYVLLSMGPLLVVLLGGLEIFLSGEAVRTEVIGAVREYLGIQAARTISTVIESVDAPRAVGLESALTLAALLLGASAVFANVRNSLNEIWGVSPRPESRGKALLEMLRTRVRAFLMVAATGLLLAVSLGVTSLAGALESSLTAVDATRARILDGLISVALATLLFGALFRTLPRVRIEWRAVWGGAFLTAVLFAGGKFLIAGLTARTNWSSYYGPGAFVVAFLLWVYLSAQIFYFGAELTRVWTRRSGDTGGSGSDEHPTA